ncbi:MAG: sulfurtransferase [Pseudomonadota bacterium]
MTAVSPLLPLIVEPDRLEAALGHPRLLIVDLCSRENYQTSHIPGAVHLEYARIVDQRPPVMGLLPDAARLADVLGALGVSSDPHVVAYDCEGGGKASRLLWTLDAIGHRHFSLLNGGLVAWIEEGHRVNGSPVTPTRNTCPIMPNQDARADKAYIRAQLGRKDLGLLDARSPGEYRGTDLRAARGGHIPGARNIEWTDALDKTNHLRLKPVEQLHAVLQAAGLTPDKEIITYCHSHHRSALWYVVLKALGYNRVRGYPGSWSDWGNDTATPIEQ